MKGMRGFTLIEVMVVIVVMGIMASLILLNINGTSHRQALQAREFLLLELKKIQREADDQAKILALDLFPATDVSPSYYRVMQYLPESLRKSNQSPWQELETFQTQNLPHDVELHITPIEHSFQNAERSELLQANAPKLIFLGNGEVKPARLQFYLEGQPLGAEIAIDELGKIHEQ